MNARDIDIVARTLYGESRGEIFDGKLAVAHVIQNRTRDDRWPNDPISVCLQPKQFSCWNEGEPNRIKLLETNLDIASFQQCYLVTLQVFVGKNPDLTQGANHFHAEGIHPYWADDTKLVASIGHHRFYHM